MHKTFFDNYQSPLGNLLLVSKTGKLNGIYFENHKPEPKLSTESLVKDSTIFSTTKRALDYYFDTGSNSKLPEIELIGTAFQKSVWQVLASICDGKTITYQDIAIQINNPKSVRAVGAAVGRNPVSILVPCHRVVGVNGLTGYAGGIERKSWLLEHEKKNLLVSSAKI